MWLDLEAVLHTKFHFITHYTQVIDVKDDNDMNEDEKMSGYRPGKRRQSIKKLFLHIFWSESTVVVSFSYLKVQVAFWKMEKPDSSTTNKRQSSI